MIAFHGSPYLFDRFDPAKLLRGSQGHGLYLADRYEVAAGYGQYCYEVEIPDGPYIDNNKACDEQPEPARSILIVGLSRQTAYRKFRLEAAFSGDNIHYYSQVGQLLCYCRKDGAALEPSLIAAGLKGCKMSDPDGLEFVVFDPAHLRIVSVSTPLKRAA